MQSERRALSKQLNLALSVLSKTYGRYGRTQKTFAQLCVDSDLEGFDEQIQKHKLELRGGKPDAYLVIRDGRIHLDLSYHSMRKVIFNTFNISLTTINVTQAMYDAGVLESYNPLQHRAVLNEEVYTKHFINYTPEDMCFVLLIQSKEGTPDKHFIIQRDKITGVSKANYEKIYIPKIKRGAEGKQKGITEANRRDVSELEQNRHFIDEMFAKCAIKFHIRSQFTSLVPGIDESDDEDGYATKKPEERSFAETKEESEQNLQKVSVITRKLDAKKCLSVEELKEWYTRAVKDFPESAEVFKDVAARRKKEIYGRDLRGRNSSCGSLTAQTIRTTFFAVTHIFLQNFLWVTTNCL